MKTLEEKLKPFAILKDWKITYDFDDASDNNFKHEPLRFTCFFSQHSQASIYLTQNNKDKKIQIAFEPSIGDMIANLAMLIPNAKHHTINGRHFSYTDNPGAPIFNNIIDLIGKYADIEEIKDYLKEHVTAENSEKFLKNQILEMREQAKTSQYWACELQKAGDFDTLWQKAEEALQEVKDDQKEIVKCISLYSDVESKSPYYLEAKRRILSLASRLLEPDDWVSRMIFKAHYVLGNHEEASKTFNQICGENRTVEFKPFDTTQSLVDLAVACNNIGKELQTLKKQRETFFGPDNKYAFYMAQKYPTNTLPEAEVNNNNKQKLN